ncbi:MAG: hypothetical protein MK116_01595 [Phycisphaerales bacterium]|nr:hypothetical protein [Phycisphaerales bacterium]
MEIGGPYPFRAAAAYQVGRSAHPGPVQTSATRPVQVAEPTRSVNTPAAINRLVAARVPGGMDFDTAALTPVRQGDAFQLYSRAADRIEAATGVQRGRLVDIRC